MILRLSERYVIRDAAAQVDSRLFPPSLYSSLREILQSGDFGKGKTAEKLEIDQLDEFRFYDSELIESLANRRKFVGVDEFANSIGNQGSNLEVTTSLKCSAIAGIIDDESTHYAHGISHEPGTVGK